MAPSIKLEDHPVDTSAALKPSKVYFFSSTNGFATSMEVLDVTAELGPDSLSGGITAGLRKQVETLLGARADHKALEAYRLAKKSWLAMGMQLRDARSEAPLADLRSTIWKYGLWTFAFPAGSPHASHDVEMKPFAVSKRAQLFVKDSVPFVWELDSAHHGVLYRVLDGTRRPIGEFGAEHGYSKDCLFILDGQELDEVVGVASVAALLNRADSF